MSQFKNIKHTNSRGANFDITVKSTNNPRPGVFEMYECVIRSINTNAIYEDTINALSIDDAAEQSRQSCERIHESSKKLASNSLNKTVTPRTKD